jgi:putative transposase
LTFENRTIGRDGIRLFNIVYWHGSLERKIGADSQKHMIKYDPRDMSKVYLAEPNGTYLEVPYRDLAHPMVSLREVQHSAKLMRKQGTTAVDENDLFRVVRQQRAIVESAKSRTQKARRKAQELSKTRSALQVPASSAGFVDEFDAVVDPFPFEIWK